MKELFRHITTVLLVLLSISLTAQNPEQLFKEGNTYYANGQYQEAIDAYKKVLDSDQESAAVYYNLANAHFKLNNVAPSIYYYEKALQLAPADRDIKNNIVFAQKMRIDAITPLPENTFQKWFNNVLTLLTTDGWAYATVTFVILFVLLFLAYYFSFKTASKRTYFITSFLCLGLGLLSLVFAYSAFAKISKDNPAIVFATESKVKSEPNLSSTEAFVLHEGTKVMILESVENWKKISLADGKTGWIPSIDVREL